MRNYVKERFTAALQLMKSIEQRKHTILRVCQSIIAHQADFLEHGADHLRPMMIKEVAEEVGVHPSTVSRAVSSKYAHTPQGVMELRSFFSESVNGPEGGGMSLQTLKRVVKKMIEEEDPIPPVDGRSHRQKTGRGRHSGDAPHRGQISRRPAHSQHPSTPGQSVGGRS